MATPVASEKMYIDGLMQGGSNSSALEMELLQSCTMSSISSLDIGSSFKSFGLILMRTIWNVLYFYDLSENTMVMIHVPCYA